MTRIIVQYCKEMGKCRKTGMPEYILVDNFTFNSVLLILYFFRTAGFYSGIPDLQSQHLELVCLMFDSFGNVSPLSRKNVGSFLSDITFEWATQ